MSGRSGEDLIRAIEAGDKLTEVERLRIVIASKNVQIRRLVERNAELKAMHTPTEP